MHKTWAVYPVTRGSNEKIKTYPLVPSRGQPCGPGEAWKWDPGTFLHNGKWLWVRKRHPKWLVLIGGMDQNQRKWRRCQLPSLKERCAEESD